jgi:RHS repeat-associated protein
LPFGEEILAGTGGRTTGQGYVADNLRQKFTLKERDIETGLDYFGSRYYSSIQGRFTGVDPLMSSAFAVDPQSWNRYAFVTNNPLAFVDDDGQIKRKATGEIKTFGVKANNFPNEHKGAPGAVFRGDIVILQTDDGHDIEAFQQYPAVDDRMRFDCHGLTFADAGFFIDNNQVDTILRGDNYKTTNTPEIGDVVVYKDKDGNIVHSATVTGTDENGAVTEVTGLGGISIYTSATSPGQGFYDRRTKAWATPSYYRQQGSTAAQRQANAARVRSTHPKNLLSEEDLKALGKPPKPPKQPKKPKGTE